MEIKNRNSTNVSMKKLLLGVMILFILFTALFYIAQNTLIPNATVSNENKEYRVGTGNVIVFDTQRKQEVSTIDLSVKEGDLTIEFNPHDIELTRDKKLVLVTASVPEEQLKAMSKKVLEGVEGEHHIMTATDQVIYIDPLTDKIINRIQVGAGLGLRDLKITPDSKLAYIAVEVGNAIYKIDIRSFKVLGFIQLPPESDPHLVALSSDGTNLYTRNSANTAFYHIATQTDKVTNIQDRGIQGVIWSSH